MRLGYVMDKKDDPSFLFFLLSHHKPEKLHRTIRISVKGRTFYLCARCAGIYAGIVSAFLAWFLGFDLPAWLWLLLLAILPVPSTVDWVTQSTKLRESRNSIRIFTGYLLGISWGFFLLLPIKGMLYVFLYAILVLAVYVFSIYVIACKTKFLDEYFD